MTRTNDKVISFLSYIISMLNFLLFTNEGVFTVLCCRRYFSDNFAGRLCYINNVFHCFIAHMRTEIVIDFFLILFLNWTAIRIKESRKPLVLDLKKVHCGRMNSPTSFGGTS